MDTNLLKGMTNKSPPDKDKSTHWPAANINSDAVRSSTAKTPKTLGPRTA